MLNQVSFENVAKGAPGMDRQLEKAQRKLTAYSHSFTQLHVV
jgi:hypothetical protein